MRVITALELALALFAPLASAQICLLYTSDAADE